MAAVKKSKELAHSGDVITDLSVAYDKYARVDPETGEVMDSTDGFVLDDESKVIWFTKKLSDWALAEQAIQTQMQGMIDHYQSKIAQLKKKSASFERHFGPQAEEFAKANLTGKSKTYSTPFASLSFRTTNPTTRRQRQWTT